MTRPRRTRGATRLVWLLGFAAAAFAASEAAAQKQSKASAAARTLTLESKADALPIAATYWPADAGRVTGGVENAAVVVLLPGGKGDRLVWEKKPTIFEGKPFAEVLYEAGFAVVTVDVRGHGETPLPGGRPLRPNDYADMVGDLEAVKEFLMGEHAAKRLNVNKLGVVASDEMTAVAVAFAKYDWEKPDYDDAPTAAARTPRGRDVRAVVLLSPVATAGRLKTYANSKLLRDPRAGIAAFIGVGAEDPQDKDVSKRLARQLRVDADDPESGYFLQTYPVRFRGTDLMGQPNLRTDLHVVNFLKKFVQDLESPWRERTSRLLR